MELIFVYNNLKAHPLKPLSDAPIPGFRVLSWEALVHGTLWNIGGDAGLSTLGLNSVKGQLWIPDTYDKYNLLKSFCRVDEGLTEPKKLKAKFKIDPHDLKFEELEVLTFTLTNIKPQYEIIHTGVWGF